MNGGTKVIQVENLNKRFGDLKVFDNMNLTVDKGERVVIIGGSGCGKSVFLRLIELLEKPDSGRIFICGSEITARNVNINGIRRRIGMVYQGFHLFDHMNVIDNITLAPVKLRGLSEEKAAEEACELLKIVGLENRKHDMPGVLSGGQKQRVAIARCMAMEPEVMLFDEPTSALDPTMVGEVLATIRMLAKRGMTMLIVTHEMAFAREVATRILYFDEGGIYEQGTPSDIFDNPQKPKTIAFVRKLKFFSSHIGERNFDLMKVRGGIKQFCEKYGIGEKESFRLQLCAEEVIYELMNGCFSADDEVSVDIEVEFSESEKNVLLHAKSGGKQYNPFHPDQDGDVGLGVTIINKSAKEISYSFENGKNRIEIKL